MTDCRHETVRALRTFHGIGEWHLGPGESPAGVTRNRLCVIAGRRSVSDPTRRRVLQLRRERPLSAGELADQFPVSRPTMPAHFAVLQEAASGLHTRLGWKGRDAASHDETGSLRAAASRGR